MSDASRSVDQAAEAVSRPLPEPSATCCGEGGVWAPQAGEPHVNGCQLCPRSATYWRRGKIAAKA